MKTNNKSRARAGNVTKTKFKRQPQHGNKKNISTSQHLNKNKIHITEKKRRKTKQPTYL